MDAQQKKNSKQPEMETEGTVDLEQSGEALISDQINYSDDTSQEKTFFSKHKNVIIICCAVVTAIGTLLLGVAAIRRNSLDLNLNSEDIIKIVQALKSKKIPQVEGALRKVEEDPKASDWDRAIVEAYRLKQAGKIEDAIKKWRSIAIVAEGIKNDLAAIAWFAVGSLLDGKVVGEKQISTVSIEGYTFPFVRYYHESYRNQDAIKKAIAAYDEAIRLKPDFAPAYSNRGLIKYALGKPNEAIVDSDRAIFLKPDVALFYLNRGMVRGALDKHKEAIVDHNSAIRLEPDFAEAYANRGNAKNKLGRHKEAIDDFDKAIHLKPDFALAYSNRGRTKSFLGKYEGAITDHDEAIRLKPHYAEAYYDRGITKSEHGKYESALEDYNEAIRLNLDHGHAYYNRGLTKQHLGKYESALVVCQPSVEGYSFLSLIRASSVVNRQWTVARC